MYYLGFWDPTHSDTQSMLNTINLLEYMHIVCILITGTTLHYITSPLLKGSLYTITYITYKLQVRTITYKLAIVRSIALWRPRSGPLLVCAVPLAGGLKVKAGCGDCLITVGCLIAGSLLVGISGVISMSSREAVDDTISWR